MLTGRTTETAMLENAFKDDRSHFIAVYGRRRIGKTYLIRETFGDRFAFQHAGIADGTLKEQLFAFGISLKKAGYSFEPKAKNWLEMFEHLKRLIENSTEKRKIVFIDELSWMDTRRCDLMVALEHFWNAWASARKDIILIVCSSATSWVLSKIIHNKGGLYNRLTVQIHLHSFSLRDCEAYVKEKGLIFTRDQILHCYMIFGGVPFYWSLLEKGQSHIQNIDRLLFSKNAPLKNEFRYLFSSVFRNPTVHLQIIQTLAEKKAGMTREELIDASGIENSGDLTLKLEELENCDFIRKYYPYGNKKKNALYQLTDCFTLFYYRFMKRPTTDVHFWTNQINTPAVNTWKGLSFERVCLSHVEQMKQKLGISGVYTEVQSWYCKADPDKGLFGSQIDLMLVRKDQVINLCEMKYAESEYTVTKRTDESIRRKIHDLVTATHTKYAVHPTLVTCYGLLDNAYAGNMQSVIVLDDLFL